jgi:hypothetical protein
MATLEEMEKRLAELESIEAIRKLKGRYTQIVDGFLDEPFESCFTENGVWDLGPAGSYVGRKAIGEIFKKVPEFQPFAIHYFVEADISVDGDKATGTWFMWEPATEGDGKAVWSAGVEYEKYERVNGEWLISELKLTSVFRTPYEQGWHKQRYTM